MEYRYINTIDSPADLKKLNVEELPEVCAELRDFIIEALLQRYKKYLILANINAKILAVNAIFYCKC